MREKDRGWDIINDNSQESLFAAEIEAGRAEYHHQQARETQDEFWNAAVALGRVQALNDRIEKEDAIDKTRCGACGDPLLDGEDWAAHSSACASGYYWAALQDDATAGNDF